MTVAGVLTLARLEAIRGTRTGEIWRCSWSWKSVNKTAGEEERLTNNRLDLAKEEAKFVRLLCLDK